MMMARLQIVSLPPLPDDPAPFMLVLDEADEPTQSDVAYMTRWAADIGARGGVAVFKSRVDVVVVS